MADRSVSARWRALSLILIGLVAGTLLLTPAGAHIGTPSHLWKKHLKAKVTAQINKHLNKPTLISVPCGAWIATGSSNVSQTTNVCNVGGAGDDQFFQLPVPIPAAHQGNAVKVTGIEFCYNASRTPVLDAVFAGLTTNADGPGSPATFPVWDETDRNDRACRLHAMDTTLTPDDVLLFVIRVDFGGGGSMDIGRTTIRIERTGSTAPPLS